MTTEPEPVATLPDLPAPTSALRRSGGVLLCVLVYLGACATPALVFTKGDQPVTWLGGEALLIGWMGVPMGQWAWVANLLLLLAWGSLLGRSRVTAIVLSLGALWLASTTSQLAGVAVAADEAGGKMTFASTGIGYVLWCASMVLTIVVAAIQGSRDRRALA